MAIFILIPHGLINCIEVIDKMKAKNQITACTVCLLLLLTLCMPARAQWTEPVRLSDFGLLNPRAIGVGDTLHVVAASGTDIYYLRSNDNGLIWTEPTIPLPDTFYGSKMPDISFSNNLVHIVFIGRFQSQQPLHTYHMSSSNGGRTWITPQLILDEGTRNPRLASHGDTLFVSSNAEVELFILSSFDNGETWNEPVQAEYTWGTIPPPYIMYSNGRIHLVYQLSVQDDTTSWEIYYRYSNDLGVNWSDRYGLSTLEHWQEGKDSQAPSAYSDSDGNIIALWFDYKYGSACGVSGDILGRVSRDNGETWLPETRLTYTQTGFGSNCLILGDKLYGVWDDYFTFYCEKTKITYSESIDWGATWSVPEVISGPAERSEHAPVLIYNISGNDTVFHCVMAVYDPPDGSGLHYFRSQEFTDIDELDNLLLPQDILLSVYPNPFNSSTVISYSNLKGGEIEIFNLRGQKVKSLDLANRKEGKVIWDATDAMGNKVTSGIFFARAWTPQISNTLKIIYIK